MDVWSVELISAFYHHCLLKFAMSMVFMGIGNFQNDLTVSSRGDGVTSAFSKLRPIWISHLYYFFPKMGKLK